MSYIALFNSGRGYYCGNIRILWKYPRSMDIIRISCIYPYFVEISTFRGYYPHFVEIFAFRVYIRIS